MAWEVCRRGDLAELVASSGSHVKTGSRFCVFGAKSTSSLDVSGQKSQWSISIEPVRKSGCGS